MMLGILLNTNWWCGRNNSRTDITLGSDGDLLILPENLVVVFKWEGKGGELALFY